MQMIHQILASVNFCHYKGENAGKHDFLLFFQCFLPFQSEKSSFELVLSFGNAFISILSKLFSFVTEFNPFPNSPGFYVSAVEVFRKLKKTLLEKEKLLVTSSFSFSHIIFYPLEELSSIFIKFEIVVCKLCQFGRV